MIALDEGKFLAIGTQRAALPWPPIADPNAFAGVMYNLTPEGDVNWSRFDTAKWYPNALSKNYLTTAITLPDGSIVACGYHDQDIPEDKTWGWLIKVDKDGCIDCPLVDATEQVYGADKIRIFPNPTTSRVYFVTEQGSLERVEVLDKMGRVIHTKAITYDNWIDLEGLPSGIYFLRFFDEEGFVVKKVVKG